MGVPILVAALARAGVVSWWWLVAPVAGFAAIIVLPGVLAPLGVDELVGVGVGMFVGALPVAVMGLRLIQRASSRVRAQEAAAVYRRPRTRAGDPSDAQCAGGSLASLVLARRLRCRGR